MPRARVTFDIDDRDVARVRKKFERASGRSLYVRLQRATLTVGDLIKRRVQSISPRQTGYLRRSVKVRPIRRGGRSTTGVLVGPVAPHRHLIIRGHRIVTPGGRFTGRRTQPNPYVDRAASGFERKAAELVRREWRSLLR